MCSSPGDDAPAGFWFPLTGRVCLSAVLVSNSGVLYLELLHEPGLSLRHALLVEGSSLS